MRGSLTDGALQAENWVEVKFIVDAPSVKMAPPFDPALHDSKLVDAISAVPEYMYTPPP